MMALAPKLAPLMAPVSSLAPKLGAKDGSGAKAGAINGSGAKVAPWRQSGAKEGLLHARAMPAQRIAPALWFPTPALSSVKSMQLSSVSQLLLARNGG